MPEDPLSDPIGSALSTTHRHLAQTSGRACRYVAAVAPFAALAASGNAATQANDALEALKDLHRLLQPGEEVLVAGARPAQCAGLACTGTIPCRQMIFPFDAPLPQALPGSLVEPLTCANAAEMLALISVAYPGFFRPETCRMGRYLGIRDAQGRLIAMGGERICLQAPGRRPWHEVSGLCSHPDHAGKGLGTAVLHEILATQRAMGASSWLWVAEANRKAIALYERSGFQTIRHTELHRLRRSPE